MEILEKPLFEMKQFSKRKDSRIRDSRNPGCWEMLGVRKTLGKAEANA